MTFHEFIRILEHSGFALHRRGATSHRVYKGLVDGKTQIVIVAYERPGDQIKRGTLSSMIRQSGLPKKLFR